MDYRFRPQLENLDGRFTPSAPATPDPDIPPPVMTEDMVTTVKLDTNDMTTGKDYTLTIKSTKTIDRQVTTTADVTVAITANMTPKQIRDAIVVAFTNAGLQDVVKPAANDTGLNYYGGSTKPAHANNIYIGTNNNATGPTLKDYSHYNVYINDKYITLPDKK